MKRFWGFVLGIVVAATLMGCDSSKDIEHQISESKRPVENVQKKDITVFVATSQQMEFATGGSTVNYQLNKKGEVTKQIYTSEYKDVKSESEIIYVIDHENILDNLDKGLGSDKKLADKYEELIKNYLSSVEKNSIVEVLSINGQGMISRSVISSGDDGWDDISEMASYVDYRYDEFGNRIEIISFVAGNIRIITTREYTQTKKIMSQKISDLSIGRESISMYQYDAEDRVISSIDSTTVIESGASVSNHVQYSYDQDGKLEKTITVEDNAITLYTYDNYGKLIKISSYAGDGMLSSVITYEYDEVTIPSESMEFITHIYDHIGIRYMVAE